VSLGRTTPILRIFDEARAREFYVDFLGFKVDWEHRFEPGLPLYAQVSREGCVLHLSEHHGDASPGAAMRIESTDLDACGAGHEELQVCTPRDRADAVGHKRHVSQGSFRQSTHLHGWRFEHRRPHLKTPVQSWAQIAEGEADRDDACLAGRSDGGSKGD